MRKLLRVLLGILLFVVGAVLVVGLVMPKDIVVTRSLMINAPGNVVFDQMAHFKNWTNWSPWYKMDSTMKITYTGTDGTPGSAYHWEGSSKTGTGDMKSTAIEGTRMDFEVTFTKPRRDKAVGILKTEDTAGGTKATWSLSMHMPYPFNAMGLFMNMDKMVGSDFEKGLDNMKKYVESNPGTAIKEIDFPTKLLLCTRKVVNMKDMGMFFSENMDMLRKEASGKINGPLTGLYFNWDTVNKCSNMAVAFPVTDSSSPFKGANYLYVAPSKAIMAVQNGSYASSMKIHESMQKYMISKGLKSSYVVEEYIVGHREDPDTNKWVTNIYYLLK